MPRGGWAHFEASDGLRSVKHPCLNRGERLSKARDGNTGDLFDTSANDSAMRRLLEKLQDDLAMIDLLTGRQNRSGLLEILLKKHMPIKLRMDGTSNHNRPHIHIDYGKELHAASYAIDSGERLVGTLNRKYDERIRVWIHENQEKLIEIWSRIHTGKCVRYIVAELKVSDI